MVGALTVALPFSAGLVSFVSPCVLPLLPANLTWVTQRLTELLPRGLTSPLGL
jgi:cytochrome c biogenesis protein CcdA